MGEEFKAAAKSYQDSWNRSSDPLIGAVRGVAGSAVHKGHTMLVLDIVDQQPAGENTRAKNHDGRQDDFPGIHCAWSPWSTDAKSVFSKFCERSSELAEVAGVKSVHAPHSTATATHEIAARQSPCTHKSRFCGATRD